MHQPIDPEPIDPDAYYRDKIAEVWCLVQEGFVDFKYNEETGVYDFTLNERGHARRQEAEDRAAGEDWKGE